MNKKVLFSIILITILVAFTGCVPKPLDNTKYEVSVKLVNSNDEIIKDDNIAVTIDNKEGNYNDGIYTFNLKNGSYKVTAKDSSGAYTKTTGNIIVDGSDTSVTLHMFRNSKSVVIKAYKDNGDLLKRSSIKIEGVDSYNVEEGYQFALDVGRDYTATISDPQGFYAKKEKTFTVEKNTDIIEVFLNKAPTGTVKGKLYLPEQYNSSEIILADISYYKVKTKSDDTGYSIEVPAGEREITVKTIYGAETTKTVNVKANETVKSDIIVPIPDNFPVEKYKKVYGIASGQMMRWKKREITYYKGLTDYMKEYLEENNLDWGEQYMKTVDIGVNIIDEMMEGLIDYVEVDEPSRADVKIIVCHGDNDILGGGKGILHEQVFDGNEVIYSEIYLAHDHVFKTTTGPRYPAHELGHSLTFGHSPDEKDLLYYNPIANLDDVVEGKTDDKAIMSFVYSLKFGSHNPFSE